MSKQRREEKRGSRAQRLAEFEVTQSKPTCANTIPEAERMKIVKKSRNEEMKKRMTL